MLRTFNVFFVSIFLINQIKCFDENFKLVSTHIVYRHGDRSPTSSYPTSLNDEFNWRNGFGQLTVQGQIQQIRLGKYFRQRYSQLLNSTYIASEINIRSSDYDRTLMSAYSNLLGLYPTSNDQLDSILSTIEDENAWPPLLPWQPIPVHTIPRAIDYLMGVSDCPYFFELVEEIKNGEEIRNLSRVHRNFFDELQTRTEVIINDLFDAWAIADTILIEALYNRSSTWVNSSILSQLQEIADLSFYYVLNSMQTNRLIAGPLIRDIMENIENFISNKSNGLKAKIYSGHDATIVSILSFFQVNYIHRPVYCSTLFFDLYYLPENQSYFLQVEYLNSTNEYQTYPIKLIPCSNEICSFDTINLWVKNRLPNKDMNTECISRRSSTISIFNNKHKVHSFLSFSILVFNHFKTINLK